LDLWQPPEPPLGFAESARVNGEVPLFGDYAWEWLEAKINGVFGSEPISENTAHLLREARELREALEAGADIRDRRGRKAVPLGPASIRKVIDALAGILDVAAEQEVPLLPGGVPADLGPTAALVAHLTSKGLRPTQVADRLEVTKSTISYHLRQLEAQVGRGYVGRRVVCEILGRSGVRASELCDLKIGQVRLHDPDGARFRIPDAKTETGVREVQMSPDLVEALVEHLDRLRRMGVPTGPGDYLVPNLHGGRLSRQRVGQIVGDAAKQASGRLVAKGLPPLPNTTPHSLRRTYISFALLANNFDVKWVMGQVGHADSKMTMDVYAQLEQRVDRRHGTSFDRLVRLARQQVDGLSIDSNGTLNWPRKGHEPENGPLGASPSTNAQQPECPALQEEDEMARVGIEPTTPRFSVVCSTN
jgi:integrase